MRQSECVAWWRMENCYSKYTFLVLGRKRRKSVKLDSDWRTQLSVQYIVHEKLTLTAHDFVFYFSVLINTEHPKRNF